MSELYSDRRWYDNPGFIPSLCNDCENWLGRGKCNKYPLKIPKEISDKSFPGTENFEENYCGYREEKTAE